MAAMPADGPAAGAGEETNASAAVLRGAGVSDRADAAENKNSRVMA